MSKQWWIYKFQNGWVLLKKGETNAINKDHLINYLEVNRIGSEIRAFINDQALWDWNNGEHLYDDTYLNGRVGLIMVTSVNLPSGEKASVAFDNFQVYSKVK